MKAKVINTVEVKEVGTINMENISLTDGQLTVHIPVISASKENSKNYLTVYRRISWQSIPKLMNWMCALMSV